MNKEVLIVDVHINGYEEVKGASGEACMIMFDGSAEGSGFKGIIGPSGVDTQKQEKNAPRFLSARYILKGNDGNGKACKIFIENNGSFDANGNICTKPKIYTDSPSLAFLETANLYGTIEGQEGGVIIHIFEAD